MLCMETVPHNILIPICNHTIIYTIQIKETHTHEGYKALNIMYCIYVNVAKGTCIPRYKETWDT